MFARFVPCLAALALIACDRVGAPAEVAPAPTPLDAPSRDAEPLSGFAPGNDAARAATGALQLRLATRMPDAEEAARGAAPQDVLTLTGETGLIVEAALTGAATPATQI